MRTGWSRSLFAAVIVAGVAITGLPAAEAYPRPGRTERVSIDAAGSEANEGSFRPSISADGRVVSFYSFATNLVPGDTNSRADVFVRDRSTGIVERVTVASDGAEANGSTLSSSLSGDGRFVAFHSAASNLVQEDTNGAADVFVHDRAARITERVSVSSGGSEGNGSSQEPSISADGRFVAFYSNASNLVPGDDNGAPDVFVHDRASGTTERVSVSSDGDEGIGHSGTTLTAPADGGSYFPSISADGRFVSFWSSATNLVPGDTNDRVDVFVHDRETKETERVSVASDGSEANGHAYMTSISADGRFVVFESWASDLVPGATNEAPDAYLHDRTTRVTERVSVGFDAAEANNYNFDPSVSADGRYVVFSSVASNLVPEGTLTPDVYVRDRTTGTTRIVSVGSGAGGGNGGSSRPAISTDGRYIVFSSEASDLVPADGNGAADVFVHDHGRAVGTVGLTTSTEDGVISVSGSATFSGREVSSATDSPDDAFAGAGEAGAELTGASITYRPEEEDLLVRLRLASLPSVAAQTCFRTPTFPPIGGCPEVTTGASAPGLVYGFGLETDEARFEIRAARGGGTPPSPDPAFALHRCDTVCVEIAPLTGGIGTTGDDVLVSVPVHAVGVEEDATLTGLRAFAGAGSTLSGEVITLDEVDLPEGAIPPRTVSLGVATSGTPEREVEFVAPAALEGGDFSGALDVSSLDGGVYELWARACLGDICAAEATPFSLDGSVTPTALILSVGGQGQSLRLEARLSTLASPPAAVTGRTVRFYSDSELIGSSVTDGTGVASVPLPPGHRGANRTYEAVFEGDDAFAGSSDRRPGRGG